MTDEGVAARYPAAPLGSGMATGSFALGALAMAWVRTGRGVAMVALLFAGSWGSVMWALLRARARSGRDEVKRSPGPPRGSDRAAWAAGALRAVWLAALLAAATWALHRVLDERVWAFLPGGLLGACVYQVLDTRDLRRWQDSTGLELCTRVGAGAISWTGDQATEAFVAVPRRPAEGS